MPPDEDKSDLVEHWLARARGHLLRAQQPVTEGMFWEDSAYEAQQAATVLTRYLVVTRYPGLAPPVTEQECDEAVALAKSVLDWASEIAGRRKGR